MENVADDVMYCNQVISKLKQHAIKMLYQLS